MSFDIDKQTTDELNLLGKFKQGSVYHLFNHLKTRGGERLMDNMFRNPLTDAETINERSSIFRFFQRKKLTFPFDVQQAALMAEYLEEGGGGPALVVFVNTAVKKCLAYLMRDVRYKKMVQGLQATIITLSACYKFVDTMGDTGNIYDKQIKAVKEILEDKAIKQLRNTDIYQELSLKTLAHYEQLLKGWYYQDMKTVLSFIYEIDVNISVSSVAESRGFSYARACSKEDNVLFAEGLCHPCIEGAVGNRLHLTENSNVVFLTGANMAGKSTLMKSVGIGIYLAHMGFPVAASKMEFSVREGLYSSINVADNIGLGYSHFYAEVVRVKQAAVAAASGKRLVLMFDELFKGTNVKDAYDGTLAVTEGFAGYHDCLFIVSTHIIEVGEALKEKNNIQFVYMPTIMDGPHPRYPYKLEKGITEDRQGMLIIRNEGIMELLGC